VVRQLSFTSEALDDLDKIQAWLTQPAAGRIARSKLAALRASIRRLRENPCLFPIGAHAGVREMLGDGGYRALYRVSPDTGRNDTAGDVRVLRVFGPGQDRGTL
jgi:plasmid stabilization system protein ParE